MSAVARVITAGAFAGSVARRAVIALTVDVNSARDVPGIDAGSEGAIAEAETCRTSRIVATATKAVATKIATGNTIRVFMSVCAALLVPCVRNAEIGKRRQVRYVVGADVVAER